MHVVRGDLNKCQSEPLAKVRHAVLCLVVKCMAFPLCNCLCLTGHTSNDTPERAFGTVGYLGSCKFQTMTLPKLKLKFSKPSNPCLTWKNGRKTEMMMRDKLPGLSTA